MAGLPFVDANIFLRHLRLDHADHSPRATAFLQRLRTGQTRARTADAVVFETVFTLERTYRQPRAAIRAVLLPLLSLPAFTLPNKRRIRRAFRLYLEYPRLSFADCYFVALMESLRLTDLVSFDQGFDRIGSITRKEPDSSGRLPV